LSANKKFSYHITSLQKYGSDRLLVVFDVSQEKCNQHVRDSQHLQSADRERKPLHSVCDIQLVANGVKLPQTGASDLSGLSQSQQVYR